MKIEKVTEIGAGLKLIDVGRYEDQRGYFMETFRYSDMRPIIGNGIVQGNESFSLPHVMRGLHFQSNPFMGKLVRTISGHMVDMCCDIRPNSPTFGELFLIDMPELADRVQWLWAPAGFAHGNMFLAPTRLEYFCTEEYNGKSEFCVTPLQTFKKVNAGTFTESVHKSFMNSVVNITDKDRNGMTIEQWKDNAASEEFNIYE